MLNDFVTYFLGSFHAVVPQTPETFYWDCLLATSVLVIVLVTSCLLMVVALHGLLKLFKI